MTWASIDQYLGMKWGAWDCMFHEVPLLMCCITYRAALPAVLIWKPQTLFVQHLITEGVHVEEISCGSFQWTKRAVIFFNFSSWLPSHGDHVHASYALATPDAQWQLMVMSICKQERGANSTGVSIESRFHRSESQADFILKCKAFFHRFVQCAFLLFKS